MDTICELQPVPKPLKSYAKEMFIAISKTCDLPDCEIKERLLFGLSHAVASLCSPQFVYNAKV